MLTALVANTKNLRTLEETMRERDPKFADLIAINIAANEQTIARATKS